MCIDNLVIFSKSECPSYKELISISFLLLKKISPRFTVIIIISGFIPKYFSENSTSFINVVEIGV